MLLVLGDSHGQTVVNVGMFVLVAEEEAVTAFVHFDDVEHEARTVEHDQADEVDCHADD